MNTIKVNRKFEGHHIYVKAEYSEEAEYWCIRTYLITKKGDELVGDSDYMGEPGTSVWEVIADEVELALDLAKARASKRDRKR